MTKESGLWEWVRHAMVRAQSVDRLAQRVERIESGVSFGIPDVNFTIDGRDGWLELKACDLPARDATRILPAGKGLRVEQIAWHVKAHACGTRSFVLIQAGDMRWLLGGDLARDINEMNRAAMSHAALWSLTGPANTSDCAVLRDALAYHQFRKETRRA